MTEFMLVAYTGAYIQTSAPPTNQRVTTNAARPWPNSDIWDAVWVNRVMQTQMESTKLGQIGYSIAARKGEGFEQ